MQVSRPAPSAEDRQKTRDRLAGMNTPGAQAAVQTDPEAPPPALLTEEQKATAAANLKARMDARRAAAAAPATPLTPAATAGTTTPSGAKKGTKVPKSALGSSGEKLFDQQSLPGGQSNPSPQMVHDALHATAQYGDPIASAAGEPSSDATAAPLGQSALVDYAHNKQTVGERVYGHPAAAAPASAEAATETKGHRAVGHKVSASKPSMTDSLLS